jgi:hypothetical protein
MFVRHVLPPQRRRIVLKLLKVDATCGGAQANITHI